MEKYHPFKSAQAKEAYLALNNELAKDWPVPFQGKRISTSYGETFLRISGPIDAPPLVLLPGANLCSLMWIPNIKSFSKVYRTYALDTMINTGSLGQSIYTKPITTVKDGVNWLNEVFNALGLKNNINIVGMSYGGWLTSQYSLYFPNRLNKMALLAPVFLPLSWKFILHAIPPLLTSAPNSYRKFFHWHLNDLAQTDSRLMEIYVNLMITSRQALKPTEYPMPSKLTDEELKSITTPTLLLIGENDRSFSVKKAFEKLKIIVPHWQMEIIPRVGHSFTIIEAEKVNQKIMKFLA